MRRPPARSCSNPPDRPLVRRLGRLTILAAAILAWPALALAQSPWEQAAANLETSFTGPVARSLVLRLLLSLDGASCGTWSPNRPLPTAIGGPDGAHVFWLGIIVKTSSGEAVGGCEFDSPAVRRWIESAPALSAAPVHLLARADDNRTRDGRARRLGRRFAAAWVWTHHPSQGRAENPRVLVGNPSPVSELRRARFPGAYKDSLRQLVCSLRVKGVVESTQRAARREFVCA
jgi:hypothetical protein